MGAQVTSGMCLACAQDPHKYWLGRCHWVLAVGVARRQEEIWGEQGLAALLVRCYLEALDVALAGQCGGVWGPGRA